MAAGIKLGKLGTFELNPRGNIWFNDDTTFGHKLLSKMGWSKGKGLGKNEDGITENIKISRKDNLTGVGFKNDACISVGCIEYENILKKLQQRFENKESYGAKNLESLEQRSRSCKSRLHYQKYIKGKDLFRCSEKDMKCIFLENPQESCKEKNSIDEEITTIKSELSVSDYFKQKMQQKQSICPKSDDVTEKMAFEKPYSTSSKKRKIEEESEIQKRTKLGDEEYLNKLSSSPSKIEKPNLNIPDMITSDNSKNKSKLKKLTKKKKIPKIKNLKSCIKLKSTFDLDKSRKVSFNEHVSYKILDNSIDNTTENNMPLSINCGEELDKVDCLQFDINTNNSKEAENEMSVEPNKIISKLEMSHLIDDENKRKETEEDEEKQDSLETPDQVEESDNDPDCLDLPVWSASSYNCWLESQRTALKMKLYKNMIKKLRKHHILSTTNLLDIKGYGNWGFNV